MPLVFERANIADAGAFLALEQKIGEVRLYCPAVSLEQAQKEIRENTLYFLKQDGVAVGTAACRVREDGSVYISNVAVSPAFRGQGIARAAMTFILQENAEAKRVDLETHPDNRIALRLYESLGFKIEGRRENYCGDGEPRLVLAKENP